MGDFIMRLRQCRQNCNLTQEEMAHLCGVAYSTYRRYESGDNEPLLSTAVDMAKALQVSLDYLTGLTESPSPGTEFTPPSPGKEKIVLQKIRKLLEELDEQGREEAAH